MIQRSAQRTFGRSHVRPDPGSGVHALHPARAASARPAVIGPDVRVTGDLAGKDVLYVHGQIEGNVTCGVLTVAEHGRINGDIRADTVLIGGTCTGTIDARVLTIHKTARVDGKVIVHESLTVQPPARFEGRCRRAPGEARARG